MPDPFSVLGVSETADDAEIRARYLALVRDFPPERDPERFQQYRAAYDALSNERARLEAMLLHTSDAALARLNLAALQSAVPLSARASRRSVLALLNDGIAKAAIL
jgi:preprotein translocase subunit Sec63